MLYNRDSKIINSELLNLPDRSKHLALSVTQVICCMKKRQTDQNQEISVLRKYFQYLPILLSISKLKARIINVTNSYDLGLTWKI